MQRGSLALLVVAAAAALQADAACSARVARIRCAVARARRVSRAYVCAHAMRVCAQPQSAA